MFILYYPESDGERSSDTPENVSETEGNVEGNATVLDNASTSDGSDEQDYDVPDTQKKSVFSYRRSYKEVAVRPVLRQHSKHTYVRTQTSEVCKLSCRQAAELCT